MSPKLLFNWPYFVEITSTSTLNRLFLIVLFFLFLKSQVLLILICKCKKNKKRLKIQGGENFLYALYTVEKSILPKVKEMYANY